MADATTPASGTTVSDTGPLDWRIAITDGNGRPTNEFMRRWNTQRSNNGLITAVTVMDSAPTNPSTGDGNEWIDISTTPPTLYVASSGVWMKVGVYDFTDLQDVPHDYTGGALDLVRVNSAEDALEFVSLSGELDLIGNADGDMLYRGSTDWQSLAIGTSGQVLEVVSGAPKWVTLPPAPSTLTIENNGTTLTTAATSINFSTNLTATASGTNITVTASGGGGGGLPSWYIIPQPINSTSIGPPTSLFTVLYLNVGDTVTGVTMFPSNGGTSNLGSVLYGPGQLSVNPVICASSPIASQTVANGDTVKINFTTPFTVTTAGLYWAGCYIGSSLNVYVASYGNGAFKSGSLTSFPSTLSGTGGTTTSDSVWAYR